MAAQQRHRWPAPDPGDHRRRRIARQLKIRPATTALSSRLDFEQGSCTVALIVHVRGRLSWVIAGVGFPLTAMTCLAVALFAPSLAYAGPRVPALRWAPCAGVKGFRCASARVPLDYRDPDGSTIQLAVMKHRADDRFRRVGTLFFNPGGPGSAKPVFPTYFKLNFMPASLRSRFDIITWDPRGTGESNPVECFASQAAEDHFLAGVGKPSETFPVGAAQMSRWIRRYAAFDRRCGQRAGKLLRHVSTADSARDLNLLRQAVGETRLNYLGISYGTFLGATYANLFPNRVRTMVLDGDISPTAWVSRRYAAFRGGAGAFLPTFLRQRADEGARETLDAFLSLCGRTSTARCAFSAGSAAATRAKFAALLRRLRSGSTPADPSYGEFVSKVVNGLYFTQSWGEVGSLLQKVWTTGTASRAASSRSLVALSRLVSSLSAVATSSATGKAAQYVSVGQPPAIVCGESPNPGPAAFGWIEAFAFDRSGPAGQYWTWPFELCATWPATAAAPYEGPWNHRTANPVLVIGNTHDPGTPYQSAVAMSQELARARLLTVDGYGHTALTSPARCTIRYETRYLIDKVLPPRGIRCRGEQPFTESP
jgi:pimeloyl-ACP methyl ester carboxylesterase